MPFGLDQLYTQQKQTLMLVPAPKEKQSFSDVLKKAANKATGGGIAGAASMAVNVCTLMWMRTTVNFQYRYGMSTTEALKHLYKEGGVRRFYRGVGPALFQGPLSRFGDTAANAGMLALWEGIDKDSDAPSFVKTASESTTIKTASASAAAAGFRMFLMPIDAMKTILQVEGADGLQKLRAKIKKGGPFILYHGTTGAITATFVGHYPWFFTYNMLDKHLEKYDRKTELAKYLGRSAIMGFCASAVSDTCSNSIRVIKTTTQTSTVPIGYGEALSIVLKKDGISGLLFRGLQTKIISNGCQGLLFSVLWRLGQDAIANYQAKKADK